MGRLKTCPYCGESIKKDSPNVPYKGRSYHKKCFEKKVKPKAELKNGLSEEEYKEKKKYFEYLRQLTGMDLSAKIYALTDDYIKKYNFTYPKMYKTLYYLKEIKGKELTGDVIGIIPYYYTEAENYFNEIDKVEEQNKEVDLSKMYQSRTVIVRPIKGHKQSLIDINDF